MNFPKIPIDTAKLSKLKPDQIIKLGDDLLDRLVSCDLCPQDCQADRTAGKLGQCQVDDRLRIAAINLHSGEEPPISGSNGSGTIFLSGCSLACIYCQNFPISQQMVGSDYSIESLADKMVALQKRGAHNINFVTPDHFVGHIVKGIGLARKIGLTIPIVYNSSGYQKAAIIKKLKGIIDIYLVDMRYSDNKIARNCSGAKRYKEINRAAVKEMFAQVGNLKCDENGIASQGVLIRHLVLPESRSGSEEIFRFLAQEISPDVYISLMSQYFPAYRAQNDPVMKRKITKSEFDRTIEMFYNFGLKNGFIQEIGSGSA